MLALDDFDDFKKQAAAEKAVSDKKLEVLASDNDYLQSQMISFKNQLKYIESK